MIHGRLFNSQMPMQAWAGILMKVYRPSLNFATRSEVVGLLGACLGIIRQQPEQLKKLNDSFDLTLLANPRHVEQRQFNNDRKPITLALQKITDYHTVIRVCLVITTY